MACYEENRMAHKNPNHAPKADSAHYYKCGTCDHLHVALVDEDGDTHATAVMSYDMLRHMIEVINGEPSMGMGGHEH